MRGDPDWSVRSAGTRNSTFLFNQKHIGSCDPRRNVELVDAFGAFDRPKESGRTRQQDAGKSTQGSGIMGIEYSEAGHDDSDDYEGDRDHDGRKGGGF